MKKLSLFLVVFLVLASFAFAQEEEAAESPLTATGSLSFSLGDSKAFDDTTTPLPVFSSTKSATATLGLATEDEKVSGTIGVNLLAPVSVSSEYDEPTEYEKYNEDVYKSPAEYRDWVDLGRYVDFYNAHIDDKTAVDEDSIWDADDDIDGLLDTLNANTTDVAKIDSDALALFTPVAEDAGDDQFVWDDESAADVVTANAAFQVDLGTYVFNALQNIIDEGTEDNGVADIITVAQLSAIGDVTEAINDATVEEIGELDADGRAIISQAVDLELAYKSIGEAGDPTVTSTVTQDFITSATLSLNQIGGVVDATFLFGGQHVSAGSINVDGSGHTATAVKPYHGMTLGLSSGVVEGASASMGLYIDDNGVKSAASDDFTTWIDEEQAVVDPKYGMTLGGGYSTSFGDISAGGNLAFGLYDLLGTPAWAVSVMPSVSGMGGSADIEIAYGIDSLLYTKAALSYGIMGITPTATIHFINKGGDDSLAYSADPTSVIGETKNAGGFATELGLGADLGQFLPVPASIDAGLDLGFPTDGELAMAWSAGLSVTPLTGLTASA
ncbi:MAG: hypothetical protein ACOCYG_05670, partial [Spirochaetota bacterium]